MSLFTNWITFILSINFEVHVYFLRIFGRFFFSPHLVRAVLCVRHNYKVVSELILTFYFPRLTDRNVPVDEGVQFWLVVQFIFCSRLRDTQNLAIMNT